MKPKIYIETTIISYLTARLSNNLIVAAHQQITHDWWAHHRTDYELYASELVAQEAGKGDTEMARLRIELLEETTFLSVTSEAMRLAEALIEIGPLPQKAAEDAVHIATSVVNGMDYLGTWNLKHIANAKMRNKIEAVCRLSGYEPVVICTLEELMEE